MATTKDKLEELNLSQDEVDRLTKAFKNEEFRKLFHDYANEIADPENRRRYEEEIAAMESERGMDVEFVHPEPGYVVKTTVDGKKKAFINVCKSDKIDKPSTHKQLGPDGKPGMAWSIPHSLAPPRDDIDKQKNECRVFDFVIHPDTYRMAETNARFKKMINDTALDGIEKQFSVSLDRKNLKFPNIKFKGTPSATVKRTKQPGAVPKVPNPDDFMNSFPYPYGEKNSEEKAKIGQKDAKTPQNGPKIEVLSSTNDVETDSYTKPTYTMKHQSEVDLQDFRDARDSRPSTRPKRLIVEIDLPLIKAASQVDLDIFEKKLTLLSEKPAKYKLDLALPYAVDADQGSAKFDKNKRRLSVTLPVVAVTPPEVLTVANETETENCPDPLPNGVSNGSLSDSNYGDAKPLIEVLSSENQQNSHSSGLSNGIANGLPNGHITNGECENSIDQSISGVPSGEPLGEKVEPPTNKTDPHCYTLVDFDYHQNDESVSLVLHAGRVDRSSVQLTFPHGSNSCRIEMSSVGSGGFPVHYGLYVQFPPQCMLETDNCRADVDDLNVVVILVKSDESIGFWSKFEAGLDENHIEEKIFLTRANLQSQLSNLSPEDGSSGPDLSSSPDLEVTEMDGEKLVVSIKEHSTSRRKKRMSESADDIEVVHDRQVPSELKGIIKQRSRTTSESSDDMLSSSYGRQSSTTSFNGSDSSVGDSDENGESRSGRKKTVSFSEHIDKTVYKTNMSVSSMRSTLKNKRKKQKRVDRRQEEKQRRRNRKTSGSDGVSSDDTSSQDCTSQSLERTDSLESETGDVKVPPSPEYFAEGDDEASPSIEKMQQMKGQSSFSEVESASHKQAGDSERTNKETSDKAPIVAAGVISGSDSASKENIKSESVTSNGDVSAVKHAVLTDRTNSTKSEANSVGKNAKLAEVSKPESVAKPKQPNLIQELDPESSRNREGVTEAKKDTVETALSWSEGSKSAEHSTKCAFDFSNSVMYDLDVD